MALTIIVRSIGSNRYFINKYILLPIFVPRKRNGKNIIIKFIHEVYLVDNLKVKMLININIIGLK